MKIRARQVIWGGLMVSAAAAGWSQTACAGPPELEAAARSATEGGGYAALGAWFGERRQFACADEAFRQSLRVEPGSAKVNYFLGLSLYASGEKAAALEPLARSEALDTAAAQPHLLRATILTELGRGKEAQAEWRAVLAMQPGSPDALDGLAKELIAEHEYPAAIELLRGAERDEDATLDLASAYGQSGMLKEAEAVVNEALAKTPASIRLTKALATVYVHQHRYQDARDLLETYVKVHAEDTDAQVQYLSILVLTSDLTEARTLGKKLLAASPHDAEVLSLNGVVERESEDYAAAREHLTEAIQLQPNNYTARYNLGASLARLGDAAGAKEQLQAAVALDGTKAEAHFQLAGVLRTLKDTAGAQRELATYDRLKKQSAAQTEAESKAEQARQKQAAGDTAGAASLYKEAVLVQPGDALLQYQLGIALDAVGDTAGELAALEAAVKIDPAFALAQNQLGYLATKRGDAGRAEACFRAAVTAAPEFTGAWVNLAATLAGEGKFADAKQAVTTALKLEPGNTQAVELSRQMAAAGHP